MTTEIKQQIETLQARLNTLLPSAGLEDKQKQLTTLQTQIEAPGFWDDAKKAQKISQQASHLGQSITRWHNIETSLSDITELFTIASESEQQELQKELSTIEKTLDQAETDLFLSGEYDSYNAIVSLHVGNGGQDAEDFTQMMLRMLLRFCESQGWATNIIDQSDSEVGTKSATIEVNGAFAYGLLKAEHGVHRLIRLSPFNAKSLRQTSFSRVEVLPQIDDDTTLDIQPDDLRIDVFRSGGAGGQSVNTTDSAVRITYLPLGISVTCQNERSQHQNKDSAMKVLQSRLLQLQVEQQAQNLQDIRGDMMDNAFGSQIRTYTLQPYKLVKDHRTNTESGNPDKVLDGDIMPFIQAYLKHQA